MRSAWLVAVLAVIGCGGKEAATGSDDTPVDGAGADGAPAGYTRLVGRTWSVDPGANVYKCARVTVAQDMYITSIKADAPAGTHHTVLSFAGANGTAGPDGDSDCGAANIGMHMLYAAGLGTQPFALPDGVGIKIAAGQQLHLNLHLFNTGDETESGESVIWVKSEPVAPPTLAEMVFAGPLDISIPPDSQPHSVSGVCTATAPYSLFAVWPHMHRTGVAQKVDLVHGSSATVLHDGPYRFEEQAYSPVMPAVGVATGDQVRVTCTYVNTSGTTVTYGDGADSEMCFAGLYRFPAQGSNEYCPE